MGRSCKAAAKRRTATGNEQLGSGDTLVMLTTMADRGQELAAPLLLLHQDTPGPWPGHVGEDGRAMT
nr:unnamed protein product [Digitaria exilis]